MDLTQQSVHTIGLNAAAMLALLLRIARRPPFPGVGKTCGSCSGPAVCADQPSIKNGSPHDGVSVCAFG